MLFSERKKLAEEYEKWISDNKDVLDCPITVISWLVGEGYLGKTKVTALEAKLAESQHENQEFISKYRYWRGECAELNKQLAEKDTKLHEYIRCALEDYNDNQKEIIELKQQLAVQSKWLGALDEVIKLLNEQLADKNKEIEELKEIASIVESQEE